jgi:hypothetical protein
MASAISIQFWAGMPKTVNWSTSHSPIDASQREAYNKELTPTLRTDLNERGRQLETALLRSLRVKRSLLDFRLLYQFLDPIEQSLIGESGRRTVVMLDLAVEFDAPVTHCIPPFWHAGAIRPQRLPATLPTLTGRTEAMPTNISQHPAAEQQAAAAFERAAETILKRLPDAQASADIGAPPITGHIPLPKRRPIPRPWPKPPAITRGLRHEIQVVSDEGMLLKSFDIREITKEAGLKFLGRRVDVQSWGGGWLGGLSGTVADVAEVSPYPQLAFMLYKKYEESNPCYTKSHGPPSDRDHSRDGFSGRSSDPRRNCPMGWKAVGYAIAFWGHPPPSRARAEGEREMTLCPKTAATNGPRKRMVASNPWSRPIRPFISSQRSWRGRS